MKYKNFLLSGLAFIAAVFYALYKRATTIQRSLIEDGYKLVSSSKNKKDIYKNILERNQNNINLIVLDPYLIEKDRKWEALSFWCDLETNKNSFLRSLNIYKTFCVMSMDDDALDNGKKYVGHLKSKKLSHSEILYFQDYFLKKDSSNSLEEKWNKWCSENRFKPIWKINLWLSKNVSKYCYI